MIPYVAIIVLAVGAGIVLFAKNAPAFTAQATGTAKRPAARPAARAAVEDPSGWIYFIGGDDTAIKIGMTAYEPTVSRLPELNAMSPVPLKLYYKQHVPDRRHAEAVLHEALKDSRIHGEWFDRDVALYYAAHLRGEL